MGRKNGKEAIIEEIRTTGKPAALRVTADTTSLGADGSDVALIHVDVVDDNGNIVPDADNRVAFTVAGGKLLGVDNGNPRDDTSFKENSRKAFDGHVFAVVQANQTLGELALSVQSDGLKPAFVTIKKQSAVNPVMELSDLK